ncbi:MAG: DEAD/DEAH box helicase [Gaiellales bacterium]
MTPRAAWDAALEPGAPPDDRLVFRGDEPARRGHAVPLPADLPAALREALERTGVSTLWAHQAAAIELARDGHHVGITSGTASGKTLAYTVPVLETLLGESHARALYLSPTKALAQDQARRLHALGLRRALRVSLVDGDGDIGSRRLARAESNLVLSNPDMVHVGICPHHHRWDEWLSGLSAIIIDEAHVYRGIFGSHVAHVIRRLRRCAALYGASPQLLLASATVGNPHEAFGALTGVDVAIVDDDDAPSPGRDVALWNPTLLDEATGQRASRIHESVGLVAQLVCDGQRVICFAPGRQLVELILRGVRDELTRRQPALADRVEPYRAGYPPEVRRQIEQRLAGGDLRAVIATNALELGIDIGDLDCAVVVGFPGSVAALRQEWGRAGRRQRGLGVLVLGDDALDQWFARHPQALLDRPVEAIALDPGNPEIRVAHLACAAAEAAVSARDEHILGVHVVEDGEALIELNPDDFAMTPAGLIWTGLDDPATRVSLRSSGSEVVTIVDGESGRVLGDVEQDRAPRSVHPGAVHLNLGERYLVTSLDLREGTALVEPFRGDWFTVPRADSTVALDAAEAEEWLGNWRCHLGEAEIATRVTGYQRRRADDLSVIDSRTLDLPERRYRSMALWLTRPPTDDEPTLGGLHAVEHLLAAALPLAVPSDAGDISGLSTILHPDTTTPTIVLHETRPGGAGIVRTAFPLLARIAAAARSIVDDCPCETGCPACIQSFSCPSLNEPLDKAMARVLLAELAG